MKIKRLNLIIFTVVVIAFLTSCQTSEESVQVANPEISQMKSISELAVMECYYHNVAKYKEEDAQGILLWKKDKHFWIEYSGIVKIGIDSSKLKIEVIENNVTISLPEAKVLDKKVDNLSLTKDSFIVDEDSADISGEDEIKAFSEAQDKMVEAASNDKVLLASAQLRVQKLLEKYINNIGDELGVVYSIDWIYLEDQVQPITEADD